MKIMVMCGSATKYSNTRGLIRWIEKALHEKGVEVLKFDAGQHLLPIYNGDDEQNELPEVKRLRVQAEQADGFFICTPEYHSGMSGALKNALDFLGSRHFRQKPATLSAVAGGGKGGINALNNLRTVVRGVYGLTLPGQFVADPDHFDGKNELVSYEAKERLSLIVDELVALTQRLANGKA
ncbi:NAD(P)H-dependent oxidoreductase [Brevibacillus fluminis]|uniref:NAD(P)H-dependent oxidoreductase n=1 Tax=Brevibacillus fluminis TaxID=511487 RepID=A0A3M8DTE2_9BACL|nr:NADPH-dependent FMN reductase [Brevibacillus fluminis]RNB91453.1 NAD(P)H-dependent oxidoreductase [Brevibacillus fluminis]